MAETSGLLAGDGILQINGAATETLEHEAAKMEIIRSGNDVRFLVQRSVKILTSSEKATVYFSPLIWGH